jgi:geranylgeranyl pyrophosphate synthase
MFKQKLKNTLSKFTLSSYLKKYKTTKSEFQPVSFTNNVNYLQKNFTPEFLLEVFPDYLNKSYSIKNLLDLNKISMQLCFDDQSANDSLTSGILSPGWEILHRTGKMWRPSIGLNIGELFHNNFIISDSSKLKLLYLVEVLHNASLIIDDIEDNSELRRSKPCVHLIYGQSISINAGISMLYLPVYSLFERIKKEMIKKNIEFNERNVIANLLSNAYFEELTAIHIGQGMDIEMKYSRIPKIETYYDTVLCKTGVFPRLVVKWILSILDLNNDAKCKEYGLNDLYKNYCVSKKLNSYCTNYNQVQYYELEALLIKLVDHLSIAFQIKDDLLNIFPSKVSQSKGFLGEDIFEGKLSHMVLHSLNKLNGDFLNEKVNEESEKIKANRLKEIIRMGTKDSNLITEAIEIMTDLKSIQYSQEIMKYHMSQVLEISDFLKKNLKDVNTIALDNLEDLGSYLVNRE